MAYDRRKRTHYTCNGRIGHITVPKNALVQPHEFNVATILSWTGNDVIFIPATNNRRTPDIEYNGVKWEIKSPMGSSSRTLENNMRLALKQSSNIIIDLQRIKLPDVKCLGVIKRRAEKLGKKYKVMVVTKRKKIVSFF